jgi:DNA-directed RNA polymerase specialized sigma subunit
MARFGDRGAYEIGNVRICTVEENHREMRHTRKRRQAFSADRKGEKNANSKFTMKEIRKIKELLKSNALTQKQIGARFGVRQSHISQIFRGEIWA